MSGYETLTYCCPIVGISRTKQQQQQKLIKHNQLKSETKEGAAYLRGLRVLLDNGLEERAHIRVEQRVVVYELVGGLEMLASRTELELELNKIPEADLVVQRGAQVILELVDARVRLEQRPEMSPRAGVVEIEREVACGRRRCGRCRCWHCRRRGRRLLV